MMLGLGLTPIMQTLVFPQVLTDSIVDVDVEFGHLQCGGGEWVVGQGVRSCTEKGTFEQTLTKESQFSGERKFLDRETGQG